MYLVIFTPAKIDKSNFAEILPFTACSDLFSVAYVNRLPTAKVNPAANSFSQVIPRAST